MENKSVVTNEILKDYSDKMKNWVDKRLDLYVNGNVNKGSETLIDTSQYSSANEILLNYGDEVYITLDNERIVNLVDGCTEIGGTENIGSTQSLIAEEGRNFGISLTPYSSSLSYSLGMVSLLGLNCQSGILLMTITCYLQSWLSLNIKFHTLTATGDSRDELAANILENIKSENYINTLEYTYSGSNSNKEILLNLGNVSDQMIYIYIEGASMSDYQSLFSITKIETINI
jgi:hypothetical protein